MLYKINSAADDNDFHFFNSRKIADVVPECFYAILRTCENSSLLPREFNQYINTNNIPRPSSDYLGNILKYLIEQYVVNFENNIKLHAKNRIKS